MTTEIVAGGTIYIHGDANRIAGTTAALDTPDPTNADADTANNIVDYGTHMWFAGRVGGFFNLDGSSDKTELTQIFGHTDADQITFDHTYPRRDRPRRTAATRPRAATPRPRQRQRRRRGLASWSTTCRRWPTRRRPTARTATR